MMHELIQEMENALEAYRPGLYKDLICNGVLSPKLLFHREVFLYFGKEKILGNNVVNSVTNTSIEFKITESTVYKIIRIMKQ